MFHRENYIKFLNFPNGMNMLHCFECTSQDKIEEIWMVYQLSCDAVFNVECHLYRYYIERTKDDETENDVIKDMLWEFPFTFPGKFLGISVSFLILFPYFDGSIYCQICVKFCWNFNKLNGENNFVLNLIFSHCAQSPNFKCLTMLLWQPL